MPLVTIWHAHTEIQSWRALILTGLVATGAMGLGPASWEGLARAVGA